MLRHACRVGEVEYLALQLAVAGRTHAQIRGRGGLHVPHQLADTLEETAVDTHRRIVVGPEIVPMLGLVSGSTPTG